MITKSPIAYIGGKSRVAQQIASMFPEHKLYVEVFAGAAWVFFLKEPSKWEIINDLDSDLINMFRCLQNHLEEFLRQFKWLLSSRELFDDFGSQLKSEGLTDIQRACRYYYVQRMCYGGRVRNRTFSLAKSRAPRVNLLRIEEELSAAHLRLCHATIENMDWHDVITRYDGDDTMFYLDPPYLKMPYYNHNLNPDDYNKIAECLTGIKGKFILSHSDIPSIRETFGMFNIVPISIPYSVAMRNRDHGKEILVTNLLVNNT